MMNSEAEKSSELEPVKEEKILSPNDEFVITVIWELVGRMEKADLLSVFKIKKEPIFQLVDAAKNEFLENNNFLFFSDFLEKYLENVFTEDERPEFGKFFTFLISEVRSFAEVYHRGYSDAFEEKTGVRPESQAHLDPLTKDPNRIVFSEDLDALINDRRKDAPEFSLIMFDIDNFKSVNDYYGHLGGDEALRGLSRAINEILRGDKLYRFGGDEFVILAKGNKEEVLELIKRIQETIRKAVFVTDPIEDDEEGEKFKITISLGAVFSEEMGDKDSWNYKKFLGRADKALYRAKEKGKDQFSE